MGMRILPATGIACIAASALSCAKPVIGTTGTPPIAISRVTVIDVERGQRLPDQTVLIEGRRIAAVGPTARVRVPSGARVLDGRGKYLIPGLWDMHVHTSREGRARWFWPLFLAHGVTGVREMGSYVDTLRYWRDELRRDPSAGPRIVWSSPMLDGVPTSWVHGYGVRDAAAGRVAVDTMHRSGFDFLKVYDRLSRDAYFAIADEAKRRGIPFAGHVPEALTPAEASDAGQRSIEHVSDAFYLACLPDGPALFAAYLAARSARGGENDSTRRALARLRTAALAGPAERACGPMFARLVANRTWLTPTLAVVRGGNAPDSLAADPRLRFVPPPLAARWAESRRARPADDVEFGRRIEANTARLVGLAHRAGVGLLAGTDASDEAYVFAGSSLHDELSLLVDAGLPPLAALQAATLNPARYLAATDSLGTIAEGKLADLVFLEADPLQDIGNTRRIHAVVADGRLIDAAARAALLDRAAREAARATVSPPARR